MASPIGEFEVLVLMAVLRLGREALPPAVRAEIENRTGRAVSRGAVYITLERLEVKGLLASRPVDGSGRTRRLYHVPARGVRAVKRTLTALGQMRAGLEPILGEA